LNLLKAFNPHPIPAEFLGSLQFIGEHHTFPRKRGDILVAQFTTPDFVPAMERAAAIVADQGGLSSHAAIVSRELGVPCVIGTKNGTRVIKDNDMLSVDARKGIIRITKRAKSNK